MSYFRHLFISFYQLFFNFFSGSQISFQMFFAINIRPECIETEAFHFFHTSVFQVFFLASPKELKPWKERSTNAALTFAQTWTPF